jgi:hypothetical protein
MYNRPKSTLFKICIHFFNGSLKISTSENVAVQWIDSIFLVLGKPAPGKNEISKTQFIAGDFSHC